VDLKKCNLRIKIQICACLCLESGLTRKIDSFTTQRIMKRSLGIGVIIIISSIIIPGRGSKEV
jgi:hypothetical protein